MKRSLFYLLWMLCSSVLQADDELVVMTYNIRYASFTPPNSWPQRQPMMKDLLEKYEPDVLGTQEAMFIQIKDLARDLPAYDWVGLGRDGGSKGEFMAVFYRKERLDPVAFDHFWLSDTPNVIASSTWGHSNRRMVTWVRFKDKKTSQEFYFFNTHFDHEVQPAREKAAELVLRRVQELKTTLPVLLVGDFNAATGSNKAYQILVHPEGFKDTWFMAAKKENEDMGTFNGFNVMPKGVPHIDWILLRGEAEVSKTEVVTFGKDGKYPSDHFPVVAWLKFPRKAPANPSP